MDYYLHHFKINFGTEWPVNILQMAKTKKSSASNCFLGIKLGAGSGVLPRIISLEGLNTKLTKVIEKQQNTLKTKG